MKKLEIIYNDQYGFIVDKEAEIKNKDFFYLDDAGIFVQYIDAVPVNTAVKILAYIKLSPESPDIEGLIEIKLTDFEEVDCWLFSAFNNEVKYTKNEPFYSKVFFNYEEMKVFSSNHSYENKTKYPDYVSTYWKHKAAQHKQFSFSKEELEELLFRAVSYPSYFGGKSLQEKVESLMKSLSTKQLPKYFILGEGNSIEEQIKNGKYET